MKLKNIIGAFLMSLTIIGCADEFVDTTPTASIPGDQVIVDPASAESALNGLYSGLQSARVFGGYEIFLTGMWADDLAHTGSFPSFAEVRGNDPALNNVDVQNYWDEHYSAIYRANLIINNVPQLDNIDPAQADRIVAEARGIRALLYYTLVKMYGGVPIVTEAYTSSDDIDQNPVARSSVAEVYAFIMDDLNFAVNNLGASSIYKFGLDAATVLKAKIEMELEDYAAAEATLAPIIGKYSLENDYASLFTGTASTSEAIFAIDFSDVDGGNHAFFFLEAGRGEVGPSADLLAAFESGDTRINQITSNGEIGKYKDAGTGADDSYIFRYADVLLMQAELLARRDDPTASDFINQVRSRAGLGAVTLNSSNVVDLIAQERRVEFFAESTDRFFTITRLGIADQIMQNKPNNVYIPERNNLWPIPQQEIERNSLISISDQNPGY